MVLSFTQPSINFIERNENTKFSSTHTISIYLIEQNIFSDKNFDTKPKFWQFCSSYAWHLYWNIGQSFRRTQFFVGKKPSLPKFRQICPTNFCPIRYFHYWKFWLCRKERLLSRFSIMQSLKVIMIIYAEKSGCSPIIFFTSLFFIKLHCWADHTKISRG